MSLLVKTAIKLVISLSVFLCNSDFIYANNSKNYAEVGLPIIEKFDNSQHQGGIQNWSIIQGSDDIIFNGTSRGMNEWDGEKWRFYPTPNRSLLRSLSQWHDGRIYTGTIDDIGYYQPDAQGNMRYSSLIEQWPVEQKYFGDVWSTAANQHGVVFASFRQLMWFDGTQTHIINNVDLGLELVFAVGDAFYYKKMGSTGITALLFDGNTLLSKLTHLQLPADASISNILVNKSNRKVVITAKHGIYEEVDGQLIKQVTEEEISSATVSSAIQASDGYYYVITSSKGLYIINEGFKVLRRYGSEHGLGSDDFSGIMEDKQGNIWLSGVPVIVKLVPPHIYSRYDADYNSKLTNYIGLFQDEITFSSEGIYQLSPSKNALEAPTFKSLIAEKGQIWDFIEYEGYIISAGEKGILAQKITNNGISDSVKKIGRSETGKALFAGTDYGVEIVRFTNGQWNSIEIEGVKGEVNALSIDNSGVVWAGTASQRLYRIENAQFPEKETVVMTFSKEDGIGPNNVYPFDLDNKIVIGTNDGLMDYDPKRTPQLQFLSDFPEVFNTQGLDVYRLFSDQSQRLWFRISNRMGFIELNNNEWQVNENVFAPLPQHGSKGFVANKPNILWMLSARGDIYRLNTELSSVRPPKGHLNIRQVINLDTEEKYGALSRTSLPTFDQASNSLRVLFALAENRDANHAQYRIRLLGSSNPLWSSWNSETQKDYTLLPGGEYTFEVEAKDNWDRVYTNALTFSILPPWYLSTLAWFLYGLAFLVILILTSWLTQKWRTQKLIQQNEALELQVSDRTKEVREQAGKLEQQQIAKDRFFANVSHEFRTPLTLAIGPLQALLKEPRITHPQDKHYLQLALDNSHQMLSLVGQLLDFNRIDSGDMKVRVCQLSLIEEINEIICRFELLLEKQKINLVKLGFEQPITLTFDPDHLNKIISNLISNAIKFGPIGQTITLSIILEDTNSKVIFAIKDQGMGIPSKERSQLFKRFYQGEGSTNNLQPGTGIGLSMVKELLALHKGYVQLDEHYHHGCLFKVTLKLGAEHYKKNQFLDNIIELAALGETENFETINNETDYYINKKNIVDLSVKSVFETEQERIKPIILVIDDNEELRFFIRNMIQNSYEVITAANGQEGLELVKQSQPDLIICDVMMPIMDGLTFSKQLKGDELTAHIPLIMLTAKHTKRDVVAGLQEGADDYLTKPFDSSELIARIVAHLQQKRNIANTVYRNFLARSASREPIITGLNVETFEYKFKALINDNIADPDLDIAFMTASLFMERTTLFRKVKKAFNCSPNQYLKIQRLELSSQMLVNSSGTVSEIAYAVGFQSLNYFSRSFSEYFKVTPSEFKNKK